MSRTILFHGAIMTLCQTDFACPICTCIHTEDDYYKQLYNSKNGLIYKSCKGCKRKLGITTNMKGDVVVWEKETEKK